MKRVIRSGVFETNSSSTHSLTIDTQDNYDAWERGELVYSSDEHGLISLEQAIEKVKENIKVAREEYDEEYDGERKKTFEELVEDYMIKETDGDKDEAIYCVLRYEGWDPCYSYSNFLEQHRNHEILEERFTTPSGDKVVAFGYFGYDG